MNYKCDHLRIPSIPCPKKQTRTSKIDVELAHLSHEIVVSIFLDALPQNRREKQTRPFRCGGVCVSVSIQPCLFERVYFTPCLFCACLFLAVCGSIFIFPCLFLRFVSIFRAEFPCLFLLSRVYFPGGPILACPCSWTLPPLRHYVACPCSRTPP